MPAKSEKMAVLFRMAQACKQGNKKACSGKAGEIAKRTSLSTIKEFTHTAGKKPKS